MLNFVSAEGPVNELASPTELAAGTSIIWVGLGLPPRLPLPGTTPHQVPMMEPGACKCLLLFYMCFILVSLVRISAC